MLVGTVAAPRVHQGQVMAQQLLVGGHGEVHTGTFRAHRSCRGDVGGVG